MIGEIVKTYWIVLVLLILIIFEICIIKKIIEYSNNSISKKEKDINRYSRYYYMCSSWLDAKSKGREVADYLNERNICTIGVYGMADIGYKLCKELSKSSNIKIQFVMDRNISIDTMFAPLVKNDDVIPNVDAIIVTPIHVFNSIEADLIKKTNNKIISLEDIIYNL